MFAMLGSHKNNLCLGLARMIGGFDTIALHQLSDCNNLLLFPQITYTSAKRKIKRLVSPTIFFYDWHYTDISKKHLSSMRTDSKHVESVLENRGHKTHKTCMYQPLHTSGTELIRIITFMWSDSNIFLSVAGFFFKVPNTNSYLYWVLYWVLFSMSSCAALQRLWWGPLWYWIFK